MKRRVADAGDPSSVRRSSFFTGADIELDLCPSCKGIWFDGGELTELLGSKVDGLPGERVRTATLDRCPSCRKDTPGGDRSCRYCGGSLKAECPRCGGTISECRFLEFPVIFCRKCRGLWIPTGLLSELHRKRREVPPDPEPRTPPPFVTPIEPANPPAPSPEPPVISPPPPQPAPDSFDGLTCVSCGKEGLTTHTSMMSADGPMCDDCGYAAQEREMRKFVEPDDWHEDDPGDGFLLGALVGGLLRALIGALDDAHSSDWSDPE